MNRSVWHNIVFDAVVFNDLEGKFALRDVAKYRSDDANKNVSDGFINAGQAKRKRPDKYVGKQDKCSSGKRVSEQLNAAV